MKKLKIIVSHLIVFLVGSAWIVIYLFNRLATPSSGAGVGGVIVMPVMIFVYIVVFGALCTLSLAIWLLVAYFRNKPR